MFAVLNGDASREPAEALLRTDRGVAATLSTTIDWEEFRDFRTLNMPRRADIIDRFAL